MTDSLTLAGLAADPQLRAVLVRHAQRGLRVQLALRGVLVLFLAGTLAAVPPVRDRGWCWAVLGCYAAGALATVVWARPGRSTALRLGWLALFGDVAALVVLTLLAGRSDRETWTVDVVVNGFFLVPLLAATQLRPLVCAAVVVPTDLAYLGAGLATREANGEPLAAVLLRTAALVGLSAGCVALSRIQRSRVLTIGALVGDGTRLLGDLLDLEGREQRRLSEQLHDGALQYVLGARMDVEDLRDGADPAALDRIDHALTESATLLRTTVGELYPAVLERAGLPAALRQAAAAAAARGGFPVTVDDDGWPPGLRTSADALVHATARELLANAVKHAGAGHVQVRLAAGEDTVTLTVTDDGGGIPHGELDRKAGSGHIGLASHRARVAAAGGRLVLGPGAGGGTTAVVTVPATPVPEPGPAGRV